MDSRTKNTVSVAGIAMEYRNGRRDFSGITLKDASFDGLDLRGIILRKSDLSHCSFNNSNLEKADLSCCDFTYAAFRNTNLIKSNLSGAVFRWALISSADLTDADLSKADLGWSKVENTNLALANLSGANISWAALSSVTVAADQLPQRVVETLKTQGVRTEEGKSVETGDDEPSVYAARGPYSSSTAYSVTLSGTVNYSATGNEYGNARKKRDTYHQ